MFWLSKNTSLNILVKNQAMFKLCWSRKLTNPGRLGSYKQYMLPLTVPNLHTNQQTLGYHTNSPLLLNKKKQLWFFDEPRLRGISVDEKLQFQFNAAYLNNLLRRQSKRTKLILTSVILLFGAIGFYLYFFGDEVTDVMADAMSNVASKSLEDDSLIISAQLHTQQIIHNILNDEKIQIEAIKFVRQVLESKETTETVRNVLINVVKNEDFYRVVADQLQEITLEILASGDTRDVVREQLLSIFMDPSTKVVLENLFNDVMSEEQVKIATSEFLRQVISSDVVYNRSAELGARVAAEVLDNETVQKKAGDALWSALKYTVNPFSLFPKTGENVEEGNKDETETEEPKKPEDSPRFQKMRQETPITTVLASELETFT